jgi:hypothetical protein
MSNISYMTPYDITTSAAKETGDPAYYNVRYSEVRLYSAIMPSGGSYGDWELKGSSSMSSHTYTVVNQSHDISVSWKSQVTVQDDSNGGAFVADIESGNPGPFYTP